MPQTIAFSGVPIPSILGYTQGWQKKKWVTSWWARISFLSSTWIGGYFGSSHLPLIPAAQLHSFCRSSTCATTLYPHELVCFQQKRISKAPKQIGSDNYKSTTCSVFWKHINKLRSINVSKHLWNQITHPTNLHQNLQKGGVLNSTGGILSPPSGAPRALWGRCAPGASGPRVRPCPTA